MDLNSKQKNIKPHLEEIVTYLNNVVTKKNELKKIKDEIFKEIELKENYVEILTLDLISLDSADILNDDKLRIERKRWITQIQILLDGLEKL